MDKSLAELQLEIVSDHFDQTRLVDAMLDEGFLDYSDIDGWYEEPEDCPEIYQWKVFKRFI